MTGPSLVPGEQSQTATFIGRGFNWPMSVDHTGSIALTNGAEDLDRAIQLVLMTAPGERLMRPEFGCKIWDLLFEPITNNLLGLMSEYVRQALTQWEPRINISNVVPLADPDDNGLIRIKVEYIVRATNDRRNLVYPFYVIPHDAE